MFTWSVSQETAGLRVSTLAEISSSAQYFNPSRSRYIDCQRLLRPLLRAPKSAQSPKECCVCDRPERLDEREEDGAGKTLSNHLCHTCNWPFFSRPPNLHPMDTHQNVSLAQTRTALEAILNDIHKEDHFALVVFDSSILTWKETLVKATAGNVSKAISYVRGIEDRGGERNSFFSPIIFS